MGGEEGWREGRENGKQERGVKRKGSGGTPEPHGNGEKSERRQDGSGQAAFASGNWEEEVGKGGTGDWISRSHNSAEPGSGGPCIGMVAISGILDMIVSSSEWGKKINCIPYVFDHKTK